VPRKMTFIPKCARSAEARPRHLDGRALSARR
jgi:hypothetical protein